jgi:anti-anti-sigma regulatory factor
LKVERDEAEWIIRLEGDYSMTAAAELKSLLLEGLASTKPLKLDLESAGEIDVSLLQLLCAAESAAAREGLKFVIRAPEAMSAAVRDAGFQNVPGAASV